MSFFFNDTATTESYTLSLHDALPISHRPLAVEALEPRRLPVRVRRRRPVGRRRAARRPQEPRTDDAGAAAGRDEGRSEEHTSELQSRQYLVCRLLLEKKKKT